MDGSIEIQLREILNVLGLLHHRNKNQHRQAKWWKWLSMLKRCLEKLTTDLEKSDAVRCTGRIRYMEYFLFSRCYVSVKLGIGLLTCFMLMGYRSFAQVIQDGQFASLGIVLVAQLAKIERLVGFFKRGDSSSALPAHVLNPSLDARVGDLGVAVGRNSPGPGDLVDSELRSTLVICEHPTTGYTLENGKQAAVELGGGWQQRSPAVSDQSRPSGGYRTELQAHSRSAGRKNYKTTNLMDDLFDGLV